MLNRRILAFVAVLALVVCAAPADAQQASRPYRGLFGGSGQGPQSLGLNMSFFGAYDSNVLASQPTGNVDPRYQQSGGYGGATASLDYNRNVGQTVFDFSGGTSYRYYPSYKAMNGANSFASAGLSTKLSPRTTLKATESAAYSPYYSLGALPGAPPGQTGDVAPINPEYPLLQQSIISLYSSGSLAYQTSARSSFAADYSINYRDYRSRDSHYSNWLAGGTYSYLMTRYTSAQFAYHYGEGRYPLMAVSGGTRSDRSHNVSFGMSYTLPISPSRSMTMGFAVGTSIYSTIGPAGTTPADNYSASNRVIWTGSAYLSRQIARSWSGSVSYTRGLQYVTGFSGPFYSDSVSASLGGYMGSRGHLTLGGAYSSGQVRPVGTGYGYGTYSGRVNYQLALGRYLATFVEYGYYHYLFDQTVLLPTGINRGVNRQSAQVGLNLWLPLFR